MTDGVVDYIDHDGRRDQMTAGSVEWMRAGQAAEDIATVVLNNMKTMVSMTMKDAPTTPALPTNCG